MPQTGNPFAAALTKHDPVRLRQAFDACRKAGAGNYDRTTLNRWLDGSIPTQGEFIRRMGEELEDPALFAAWERIKHSRPRTAASPEAVIRQFAALSYDDRQEAYPEIRKLFLERFTEQRSRASHRIELRDGPNPESDFHELRLVWEWDGRLPANARAIYAIDNLGLGDAYDDPKCVFREVLPIETETFATLLETWPEQILNYNPLGTANQQMYRHVGVPNGCGVFQFDNEEVDHARVRWSLTYPYPKGHTVYFIRFGNYRYGGGAEISLALTTAKAHSPRVFTYLPAGRQREYAGEFGRSNELQVTLGAGGTILSDGDGAVLFWSES